MKILKIGYYSYIVPYMYEVGKVVDLLSNMQMIDTVYENGRIGYYRKETEEISISRMSIDKVYDNADLAREAMGTLPKDE